MTRSDAVEEALSPPRMHIVPRGARASLCGVIRHWSHAGTDFKDPKTHWHLDPPGIESYDEEGLPACPTCLKLYPLIQGPFPKE